MDLADTPTHCANQVRDGNRPRFVASLFAPADRRRALFALYALDEDLLRIRQAAREPMIVAMRFQWWRDAVAKLPDYPVGHPVLTELSASGLRGDRLALLVDARDEGEAADGERKVIAIAAEICGASPGANDIADRTGTALASQDRAILAEARSRWAPVRSSRKAELPAYLPATIVDMAHPVTPFRLYLRMLLMGLRNRF